MSGPKIDELGAPAAEPRKLAYRALAARLADDIKVYRRELIYIHGELERDPDRIGKTAELLDALVLVATSCLMTLERRSEPPVKALDVLRDLERELDRQVNAARGE